MDDKERLKFWLKVNQDGPLICPDYFEFFPELMGTKCWLWTGGIRDRQYGSIRVREKMILSHRFSWVLHNGPIPTGLLVLHACDVPLCVNPLHLWLGTHKDNADDMRRKNRARKGEPKAPPFCILPPMVQAAAATGFSMRKSSTLRPASRKPWSQRGLRP